MHPYRRADKSAHTAPIRHFAGLAFAALMVCSGCGRDDRIQVYPVRGKVLVNGQPAEGARVVFYVTSSEPGKLELERPTPAGTTDADGVYRLDSYGVEDGAPAGEFKVTVVWPQPPPPNFDGIYESRDRLGGRYADPQKSNLTARVKPGGGEIAPFQLR